MMRKIIIFLVERVHIYAIELTHHLYPHHELQSMYTTNS